MADARIERLAGQVLEAISDPRVCGRGADALRNTIKRELRQANENNPRDQRVPGQAINHASARIAGHVEDICRGLPANVRAVGTVVAAAGAVYGVSQMSEQEIKDAIARMSVDVVDTRLTIAGQRVDLSLSTTLAPLFGENPTAEAEARWQQELFGYRGAASVYARDLGTGDPNIGVRWRHNFDGGSTEFGANNRNGGTVYFRLEMRF